VSVSPHGARASEAVELPEVEWSFDGIFGKFDKAQLQRGFQVYDEVCSSCHSLRYVAYRNLAAIGFDEERIKEIAAEKQVPGDPDEDGEPTERDALPSDKFVPPYANDNAARSANNGALPPDLSILTKARGGGADYIYGLLVGYEEEAPEGVELAEGMAYNHVFPGKQIAMPAPLDDEAVEYEDGTEATLDQHSRDVTAFMVWAAEPELETRKRMGIKVVLFLIVLTALLYAVKRKVWADLH
jgi:ubiquinol-cytochrome c reductase cytochrome c1 subunit